MKLLVFILCVWQLFPTYHFQDFAPDSRRDYKPYDNGTLTLRLVHAIWRHGDRSPTETFKNDYFQESAWTFGGGGWGQLSPTGMMQHLSLGIKIRNRYVNGTFPQFLPRTYNSKAMYIRSTDINRTLLSATSNMIGMYGLPGYMEVNMTDFPDEAPWPSGFVPIPIHTINDNFDHLIDVDNYCPFQDAVWDLAKTTPEVAAYINSTDVQNLLKNLSANTGEEITVDNLWITVTALKIEKSYFETTLREKTKWYSDELYEKADIINDQIQLYQNGIFKKTIKNGIDVGNTLKKIRGGSVVNEIANRIQSKLDCMDQTDNKHCTWINNLNYYAYSAHDTAIYAMFSCLDVEEFAVQPRGYPLYSAAAFIELWTQNNGGEPLFRLMYHRNASDDFIPVTMGIPKCNNSEFCPFSVWKEYALQVVPDMPMVQWCKQTTVTTSTSTIPFLTTFTIGLLYLIF